MHVIELVTKTVNRDGKKLRHLKSRKINLFQSFLYFLAFNLVFICPTLCHLKTTCLLLMKQKLYALDAFFIEKLKLSENDPSLLPGRVPVGFARGGGGGVKDKMRYILLVHSSQAASVVVNAKNTRKTLTKRRIVFIHL